MKISILTPSYNSVNYIQRSIESVLLQSYKNWEHIIVDGGSTDGTLEILKKYTHLRWISESDQGQSDAMNKAFQMSTGNVVVYLNTDDEFAPGVFSYAVSQFRSNNKLEMLVGNIIYQTSDQSIIHIPSIKLLDILDFRKYKFPLNPVSYFYKPTLQKRIGLFPVTNHYTMDYWFLLRAFLGSVVIKCDYVFGTYHFDGKNKSANTDASVQSLKLVLEDFIHQYSNRPEVFYFRLKRYLMYKVKYKG